VATLPGPPAPTPQGHRWGVNLQWTDTGEDRLTLTGLQVLWIPSPPWHIHWWDQEEGDKPLQDTDLIDQRHGHATYRHAR
jgi:hypothetical protein